MRATTTSIEPGALSPKRWALYRERVHGQLRPVAATALSLGPALVAVVLAVAVAVLHWKGVDQAAQSYRVLQVRAHGLSLWDSGWYGGNYPLGYSLVFPVIGAAVGLPAAGAAAAAGATWSFDRLVSTAFGRRPLGVWYFAASTMLAVAIGQLPFLAGEALGLAGLVALRRDRRVLAVALVIVAAACSPLAAAFVVMACAAWFWHRGSGRLGVVMVAGGAAAVIGSLGWLFPGTGPFPFPFGGLVVALLASALLATSMLRSNPVIRLGAAIYVVACVASFLVPNPLGGNAPRLAATVGVPLLICLATAPPSAPLSTANHRPAWADPPRWPLSRWWRPTLTVGALGALAVWQWAPGLGVVTDPAAHPAVTEAYYLPLVHQIEARSHGPVRVEIPPTRQHWEAAWVAPYVSLARGWERQLDIADNPIFYRPGLLGPASFRRWMLANGVTWVALPATPLDYAGADEAGLLHAGEVRGLRLVWSNRDWKLWRVVGTPGLVSGAATLQTLAPDAIRLSFSRPETVTLRVRFSAFSTVRDGNACLRPDPGGWTTVKAGAAGAVTLATSVFGSGSSRCPAGS